MSKIGFFGGTFDPIHFGHINFAIQMMENFLLDKIIFCLANIFKNNLGDKPVSEFMSYINEPNHPKWTPHTVRRFKGLKDNRGQTYQYKIFRKHIEDAARYH